MAVTFNYANWIAQYPEFAAVITAPMAQGYFNRACFHCDNTANSPVTDDSVGGQRETLLYLMTAHIAALFGPVNNGTPSAPVVGPSSPLVGRISNASEGSVSVQADLEGVNKNRAWYAQTKYGLEFWTMSSQYRRGRYFGPCPPYTPDPYFPLAGRS